MHVSMFFRRLRLLSLAVLLVAAGLASDPADAQKRGEAELPDAGPPPTLTKFKSKSYTVHHNLTDEHARRLAEHMDLFFTAYDKFLAKLDGRSRPFQNLYLINFRDEYIALLASKGIDASASGGIFFRRGDDRGLATFIGNRDEADVLSTLQHEGFHQFAEFKTHDNLPLWVNEGLAEYFGDATITDGKLKHGLVHAVRLDKLRNAAKQQHTLPFDDLLNITSEQWWDHLRTGPTGHAQYDQSWSVVHFLIHADKKYEKAFSQYLILLSTGRTHQTAFARAFGSNDTTLMQQQYQRFLEALTPTAQP